MVDWSDRWMDKRSKDDWMIQRLDNWLNDQQLGKQLRVDRIDDPLLDKMSKVDMIVQWLGKKWKVGMIVQWLDHQWNE